MAIKIHHGPNGSYKTSGAIQDDAVPALKAGRYIITNVRGFTLERVLQVMPDIPASTDIINLSLESLDDMEKMRTWFQWAMKPSWCFRRLGAKRTSTASISPVGPRRRRKLTALCLGSTAGPAIAIGTGTSS